MERRSEIYVTRKLAKRLRMVLKIYPQMTTQHHERDSYSVAERLMTVEELVDRHLNEIIEDKYPVVIELEKRYAKLEKEMAAHAKRVIEQKRDIEQVAVAP
jgi:hypothetical protein